MENIQYRRIHCQKNTMFGDIFSLLPVSAIARDKIGISWWHPKRTFWWFKSILGIIHSWFNSFREFWTDFGANCFVFVLVVWFLKYLSHRYHKTFMYVPTRPQPIDEYKYLIIILYNTYYFLPTGGAIAINSYLLSLAALNLSIFNITLNRAKATNLSFWII